MEIIILIAIVAIAVMAKHGRRGRRRWTADMQAVQLFQVLALSTLASSTMVGADMVTSGNNEYRWLSLKGYWSLRNHTSGEGPITFGIAHSDYSDTEIEQFLENENMLNRGDLVSTREIGRRLVRRLGQFSGVSTDEVVNDGKPLHTRVNWAMAEGSVPRMWAYNFSGATLTTGSVVSFQGKMTIRWL